MKRKLRQIIAIIYSIKFRFVLGVIIGIPVYISLLKAFLYFFKDIGKNYYFFYRTLLKFIYNIC